MRQDWVSQLRLQIQLPANGFILDHPVFGQLDTRALGAATVDNNLFILDRSVLDGEYLGQPGDDANSTWVDFIQFTHSIRITRGADATAAGSETKPGIFNITLIGPELDPHQNLLVTNGRPVRLVTSSGTLVFTGTIRNVTTSYAKPVNGEQQKPRVVLTVTDAVAQLANITQAGASPSTVGVRADALLGGANIPYNRQGGTAALAGTDLDANLVEHLQVLMDSDGGYWFVDRAGAVQVVGGNIAAAQTPVMKFMGTKTTDATVAYYTNIRYGSDTGVIVNQLNVQNMTMKQDEEGEWEGVEETYNYTQPTSVATWGPVKADLVTNLESPAAVNARAAAVLAGNATPANIVSDLQWDATKDRERAAKLEPYQIITVQFENDYFEEVDNYRIMTIEHEITTESWFVTLTLDKV